MSYTDPSDPSEGAQTEGADPDGGLSPDEAREAVETATQLPGGPGDPADLPTPGELDPNDDDPLEGADPTPGERLDTGEDIGHTLPVESDGTLLDAPASAVLDPGPPPVTPGASQQAYHDRVAYENGVNAQLETWWETNKAAVLDTFLAGGEVELSHNLPEQADNPTETEEANKARAEEATDAPDGEITPKS